MDYRVAVDATGQAAQALMGAAQVAGIPHGFIIGLHLPYRPLAAAPLPASCSPPCCLMFRAAQVPGKCIPMPTTSDCHPAA